MLAGTEGRYWSMLASKRQVPSVPLVSGPKLMRPFGSSDMVIDNEDRQWEREESTVLYCKMLLASSKINREWAFVTSSVRLELLRRAHVLGLF